MRHGLRGGLAALAVLVVGAATLMVTGDEGSTPPPPTSTPRAENMAELTVPTPMIDRGACAITTYHPPAADLHHEADWCRPEGGDDRGAVVLLHGGGGFSGDRSSEQHWARWYRDQGFATLAVDYTLTTDVDGEAAYPRPEQDTKAAIQFAHAALARAGRPDAPVLVHGNSAGAHLAGQALVTSEDDWFSGPGLWPDVSDRADAMIGFYGYYDGEVVEPDRYYGGPPETSRAVAQRWRHADSVRQAAQASGPALLFHGDVDTLITVEQTETFGRALAQSGGDVTTFILTDADHAFDGRLGDLRSAAGREAAGEVRSWLDARFPSPGPQATTS